ncbi:MAG: phage integrase SAM-like domain and Arm DNA-binding domain-containing protein [Maribacter sp.]
MSLGKSVQLEFWDDRNEKIRKSYKGTSSISKLNNQLLKEKTRAIDIVNHLNEKEELSFLSILQLKSKIVRKVSFDSFFGYSATIIDDLKKAEHYGNANTYYAVTKILRKFNDGNDLKFNEINYDFLKRFERRHFSRGNSVNGLSAYMRTIRAIFNKPLNRILFLEKLILLQTIELKQCPPKKEQ